MRFGVAFLVAAVLALSISGQAHAQFSVQDRLAAQADALRVADDFGACVVSQYTATARRIVVEPVDHDRLFNDFRTVISGNCINESDVSGPPSQMWMPYPTVHAVLADNLIKREFRRSGPSDLSNSPPIAPIAAPTLPSAEEMTSMSQRERDAMVAQETSDNAWVVLQRIGICTARRAPDLVRQVSLTRIGSDEERAAMAALSPEIGGCVPTGATIRLRRAELRWAAALGYYRLAAAMGNGASSAGRSN